MSRHHCCTDAALQAVLVDFGSCVKNEEDLEPFNYTLAPPAFCPPECVPSQYALKEYINRTGPFMSEVISTCAMSTTQCSRCERRSQNMTFFPGSPYERTVDRGICNGRCEETGESCVAVRSRTLSLENSNGAFIISKVETCGCKDSGCYREDYFSSYWEEVTAENGTEGVVIQEKVINVGRCKGSCNGVFLPDRCYPSPSLCLIRIPGGQSTCVPATSTVQSFTSLDGVPLSVVSIATCLCLAA